MLQDTAPLPIKNADVAISLGDVAPSMPPDDDAELKAFIDLLRAPFNIGDWNDRDPMLVLFLRSTHLWSEEHAS